MENTISTIKHSWGGSSYLTSALIWAKYGYWCEHQDPPEWYNKELELAEAICDIIQEPDVKYEVTFDSIVPGEVHGHFKCWDEANPFFEPWEVGFRYKSKESALANYQKDYCNHKRLHNGVVKALLHYKETGEPVEPEWLPRTNSTEYHWEKKGYNPDNHKGFRLLKRHTPV